MKSKSQPHAAVFTDVWRRIERAARLALFLDFDGTLAPIVAVPSQACLPYRTRRVLEALAADPGVTIAIVSGRSIQDLKARAVVRGLIYAGNHGHEIEGPDFRFQEPAALASRSFLTAVCAALSRALRNTQGVIVEDKGLTASLHYRMVSPEAFPVVQAAVAAAVGELFRVRMGRKVIEILPDTNWNKGSAVTWILERIGKTGLLPVCFGDDVTDEDLFGAVPEGISVKVGSAEGSSADYRVSDTEEVSEFLQMLVAVRKRRVDR